MPKESILSLIQSPELSLLFAGNTEYFGRHHECVISNIQTMGKNQSKGADYSKEKLEGNDRDGERSNKLKEIQDLNFKKLSKDAHLGDETLKNDY